MGTTAGYKSSRRKPLPAPTPPSLARKNMPGTLRRDSFSVQGRHRPLGATLYPRPPECIQYVVLQSTRSIRASTVSTAESTEYP